MQFFKEIFKVIIAFFTGLFIGKKLERSKKALEDATKTADMVKYKNRLYSDITDSDIDKWLRKE